MSRETGSVGILKQESCNNLETEEKMAETCAAENRRNGFKLVETLNSNFPLRTCFPELFAISS